MSVSFVVGVMALVLVVGVGLAFLATLRKMPTVETVGLEETDPDIRLRLKPIRRVMEDMRSLRESNSDASAIAGEGLVSLEETYHDLRSLAVRRKELVRQSRTGIGSIYEPEIAKIDDAFRRAETEADRLREEIHRLAAHTDDLPGLQSLSGLKAVAETAKELQKDRL